MLRRISIDEGIVAWISTALRESHSDQKRFRDEGIAKLKADHLRLQKRLDLMYDDRLDGRIDLAQYERKSGECRDEQARILAEIEGFGAADGQYMEAGIKLLELTRNMHRLFEKQQADEKRRFLNFVVSNSIWKGGEIVPEWRQPFDMIAVANAGADAESGGDGAKNSLNENWLPELTGALTFSQHPRTYFQRLTVSTFCPATVRSVPREFVVLRLTRTPQRAIMAV
jgi:hypothetical protein